MAIWFTPENLLAEGSVSNVFLVADGKLRTPPLETPVLPGVTRAAVLELAGENDISADEAPCTINDLLNGDEVFLTNAIMQVLPVARVEKHDIAKGVVGPIAKQLYQAYRDLVRKECSSE